MKQQTEVQQTGTILIVEDEAILRESMAELLEDEGFNILQAANGRIAYDILMEETVDVVLSDIRMPEMDGIELLDKIKASLPETPVIIITAYGDITNAVDTMRHGACDYLVKPVQFDEMVSRINRVIQRQKQRSASRLLSDQISESGNFHNLVGKSRSMLNLFEVVRKLSEVKSNVLLVGDSGTGKELFARAIHFNGITRDESFVPVNCGGMPDSLIESELFGHCRGAFTGAHKDKIGYFEAANGGTLFLDEISTLPLVVQSTLLRVLEDKTIVPVGDTHPRCVDVRIIAASNQNLEEMVEAGQFREDVLYRLNVVKLELPALRDRREDIPLLVNHFLQKHCTEMNRPQVSISDEAILALMQHDWPGNIRELENAVERAIIFAVNDRIEINNLPYTCKPSNSSEYTNGGLKEALRQFERQYILEALQQYDFNKFKVAQNLQIGVSSLYRKIDDLNIPTNDNPEE